MKIGIVGASGFIGTNMMIAAHELGHDVVAGIHQKDLQVSESGIDIRTCNLNNENEMKSFFKDVDWAINCSGAVSAANVTVNNPLDPIFKNLILNTKFIEACVTNEVSKMSIFGSSTGYPALNRAVTEDDMFLADPAPVYEGYGRMRRYIERLSMFSSLKSNTQLCIIRPSAVYGPYDDFSDASSHVIPALIKRAIEGEDPYVVWGNGKEIRDFMYIDDFCKSCILATEKYSFGKPINIACGQAVTIAQVVETLFNILGKDLSSIQYDVTKPTTIPIRMVDTSLAKSILGEINQTSLFEGLRKTVAYYVEGK